MSERVLEIEAESLEEARERLQSSIPDGFQLLSERVVSDGEPKSVRATAETVEKALSEAHGALPDGVEVLESKELATPGIQLISVAAFDEESALSELRSLVEARLGVSADVANLRLIAKGTTGFLGIGKKPNRYQAELRNPAVVEITYKTKARISARIGALVRPPAPRSPRFAALLARFDATQGVGEILFFVAHASGGAMEQLCAYYPLENILPGLEQGDVHQLRRLERITTLAVMLAKYDSVRQSLPQHGLPADLDHEHLADTLIPRLIKAVRPLRGLASSTLPASASTLLYKAGVEMVEKRPRDALVFLQASRELPGPPRDLALPLCSCYFKIAQAEKGRAAIDEAMRRARSILAAERELPGKTRDAVQHMLDHLENLKAESGVS